MNKQQMKVKIEEWIQNIALHYGHEGLMYRFEDVSERSFKFYHDGFLNEVINGYREDGMFKASGIAFEVLGMEHWDHEPESGSIEFFIKRS